MTALAEKAGRNFLPQKNILLPRESERELGGRFAKTARLFTIKQLSTASDATIDAAKRWPHGHMPNAGNIFAMARKLEAVRNFVLAEIGCDQPPAGSISNPRLLEACFAKLQEMAREPTQEGAMARDILLAVMNEAAVQPK